MKSSLLVIAGNRYIANYALRAGAKRVEVIPSVVDTNRYIPAQRATRVIPIVGWIGTPKTSSYLKQLISVFKRLALESDVRFVAVGAHKSDFADTLVEVWPWSETSELRLLQKFDIGVMPLTDTPWDRGKCGYKLIQCMACAKPVVASPVGVNCEIIEHGINGYLAATTEEWYQYLRLLLQDLPLSTKMGRSGRHRAIERYSLMSQAPHFALLVENTLRFKPSRNRI